MPESEPDRPEAPSVGGEKPGRPVSRFWACFFSLTIFGFLWTRKMGKTARWLAVFVPFAAANLLSRGTDGALAANPSDEFVFASIAAGAAVIGLFVLCIVLMFRWATRYNLDNFGYPSKEKWRQAKGM